MTVVVREPQIETVKVDVLERVTVKGEDIQTATTEVIERVTVSETVQEVVNVAAVGPQGPAGPAGAAGPTNLFVQPTDPGMIDEGLWIETTAVGGSVVTMWVFTG